MSGPAPEMRMEVWRLPANEKVTDLTILAAPPMISHPYSGEGAMRVLVPLDSDELALIQCPETGPTDYIRFYVDDELRASGLVERITRHTLDEQEGSRQVAEMSGRSVNAVLEHALVFPALGVDALPVEEVRLRSWQAPDYDSSAWLDVVEIATAEGPDRVVGFSTPVSGPPAGAPQISGAYHIWAAGDGVDTADDYWAPGGTVYARKTFTLAADRIVEFGLAIDNYGSAWIDGQPIAVLSQAGGKRNFLSCHKVSMRLSAGDHTIAIRATNNTTDKSGSATYPNPATIFCYVATLDDSDQVDTVLAVTDGTWDVLGYPATPPGMTPGEAVELLLVEAQTRGRLPFLTWVFDGSFDSNDNAWPVTGEISTPTGNDLLSFLLELSVSYVDWRVTPDCTTLEMVDRGTYAQVGDPAVALAPAPADDAESGQLTRLDIEAEAGTSALLVRYGKDPGGWSYATLDDESDGVDYIVEAALGVPHLTSRTEALKQAGDELLRLAFGLVTHRIEIDPTTGAVPWVDFGLGDLVEVDGTEYRVRDIPMTTDPATGRVLYSLVWGDGLTAAARNRLSNKRMANGTVGGRSLIASPLGMVRGASAGDDPPSEGCCMSVWQGGSSTVPVASSGSVVVNPEAPEGSDGWWLYPTASGPSALGPGVWKVDGFVTLTFDDPLSTEGWVVVSHNNIPDGGTIRGYGVAGAGASTLVAVFTGAVRVLRGTWTPEVTVTNGTGEDALAVVTMTAVGSCACEHSVTEGGA